MEKINSKATFFWKYLFSGLVLSGLVFFLFMSIYKFIWPAVIGILIIGTLVFNMFRSLLMNLKTVYLDEANDLLLVKHNGKDIPIEISKIKKVDKILLSITILDVKLKEKTELGWDFIFMPRNTILIWSKPETQLQKLIDNHRKT